MRADPLYYERCILRAVDGSPEFFDKVRPLLCRDIAVRDKVAWSNEFSDPVYYALYRSMGNWYATYTQGGGTGHSPIHESTLRNQVMLMAGYDAKNIHVEDVPQCVALLSDIRSSIPLNEALVTVVNTFTDWEARRKTEIYASRFRNSTQTPKDFISNTMRALQDINESNKKTSSKLADWLAIDEPAIRRIHLTAMPNIMQAVGGGFGNTEHTMFCLPSGGGKTVLACQISTLLASNGYKALLVTTEQPPGELAPRMVSSMCRIPFKLIKDGMNYERQLSGDYLQSYKANIPLIKDNVFIEDWSTSCNKTVSVDLEQRVKTLKASSGCDVVILDWIGGVLGADASRDRDNLPAIYSEAAASLSMLARRQDVHCVSFAQASQDAKEKKWITSRDTQHSRTMHQTVTTFAAISAVSAKGDKTEGNVAADEQSMYVDKARKAIGMIRNVRRDFDYQQFTGL